MLKVTFGLHQQDTLRQVLCLGAHSDDIEIGCGGTILKLIETYPEISIYWVVFGATDKRQEEALASAHAFLKDVEHKTIVVKGFRDRFFPYIGADIKTFFDQLSKDVQPDLVLTHYRHDLHQDHRLISELTWNAFRNHLIWEYEIPKYDGDIGNPNFFVHLSPAIYQKKISHLMQYFATQANKQWFTEDTFAAIARLRGIESNAPQQYAEAFYCRKAVLL